MNQSTYESIRLPAKAVAPYRKVALETGIPLTRLIAMALERFDVQGVAHAMQKLIKPCSTDNRTAI